MIRVIQRRLIIPRGDTGIFTIPAMTQAEGAIGVFTIFDPITNTRIFQKQVEIEGENFNISFSHADTVNLKAGDYLWDIKFYKNPILADNKVIDGEEINSYYAAFQAPKCEIRETGDDFLMIEGQPAKIEDLNIILAATEAANAAKVAATEKAEEAAAKLAEMIAAIPTKVSELENDSGYLQAETDPTVPAWAKAQTKPSYTPQEVGALPADTFIPSKVSDLTDDSGHYTKPASGIPASDLEETYLTEHQDLSNYVQKTDYATEEEPGIIRVNPNYGLVNVSKTDIITGESVYYTAVMEATSANIKEGTDRYRIISSRKLPNATFYGLAKAAGDTTQSQSSNAVGAYTNEAKAAIQQMLDVPSTADIPINVSELTNDTGYLTEHQDISGKANSADLAAVATSGDYDDLLNKPTIPEVPVQDVQIDGTSILQNGVANIPKATSDNIGLVKARLSGGLAIDGSGALYISGAFPSAIKAGTEASRPIVPITQHTSVFYGLATAAGDTTQSQSSNAVGTYTDSAKTAIQQMLGVPAASAIPTQVSQLQNDSGYLTSFTETDPTVPAWAKAATKPSYTAAEVGAPTVQEMNSAISTAIGNVNSFDMAVVQELPTQDISTHTIYLVPKTGETNDVYDEYVYINNAWEMVGNTQVDLSNYVQKTDYATKNTAGVVKINGSNGIVMLNNELAIAGANATIIKQGTDIFRPIVADRQHASTFYGLAKAAGDTTQSQSDNVVGQYTDEAKVAIQTMLDVPAKSDIPDVPVQDVQVNGVSVLSDGVANVPKAGASLGVVRINSERGISISDGLIFTQAASTDKIKAETDRFAPIVPWKQHESTFYGLSKVAGVDLANETVTLGTYPEASKTAIKAMLGVQDGLKVVRLI